MLLPLAGTGLIVALKKMLSWSDISFFTAQCDFKVVSPQSASTFRCLGVGVGVGSGSASVSVFMSGVHVCVWVPRGLEETVLNDRLVEAPAAYVIFVPG